MPPGTCIAGRLPELRGNAKGPVTRTGPWEANAWGAGAPPRDQGASELLASGAGASAAALALLRSGGSVVGLVRPEASGSS